MRLRSFVLGCLCVLAWQASVFAQSVDNPRVVTVSPDGSGADYANLQSAINSITTASASNRFVVLVYPGIYTGANNSAVTWKSYVSLRGVVRDATIIKGKYDNVVIGLMMFSNLVGVEVSNITFDASAQQETGDPNQNGALVVNGADIVFENVVMRVAENDYSNFFPLSSAEDLASAASSRVGNVTVKDCVIGGGVLIADNNWTIEDSTIVATEGDDYVYGVAMYAVEEIDYVGDVTIQNCHITARDQTGTGELSAIWLGSAYPQKLTITNSTLHNDGFANISAPIFKTASETTTIDVDNSVLITQSPSDLQSGEYFGLYIDEYQGGVTSVRNSAFRSFGSGGTRADIENESAQSDVVVSSSVRSTGADSGPISTSDLRQGSFSTDLVVPLLSPTLGPLNGQVWIDTVNNKLCYRSGGSTRCVTGS